MEVGIKLEKYCTASGRSRQPLIDDVINITRRVMLMMFDNGCLADLCHKHVAVLIHICNGIQALHFLFKKTYRKIDSTS